jgi:proteasome activator subunit 4
VASRKVGVQNIVERTLFIDLVAEQVLKALRSALDVVTYHLSDAIFDLVLKLVFDYASTNARANSIRAFGYIVACLSRARPKDTLARFLPHCIRQVEVELAAGASSVRTTAVHGVISSDTTLLWNMTILRGLLGYGGQEVGMHSLYQDDANLFDLNSF